MVERNGYSTYTTLKDASCGFGGIGIGVMWDQSPSHRGKGKRPSKHEAYPVTVKGNATSELTFALSARSPN